jgi:6-pyruvoyl-tetrahydropterin synthase
MTFKTIWVTSSFVAYHRWPDAPPQVGYLRNLHRHTFNVKLEVRVSHDDRQVEFHILKRELKSLCAGLDETPFKDRESWSCEQYCDYFLGYFNSQGYIVHSVAVDEDGECGAIVRKETSR